MSYILIIDDDESVNQMLQSVLKGSGYDVVGVTDSQQGIEIFRKNPPILLILDILMPGKDGLETIIELRKENSDAKIIAISGGGRLNAFDYLETAKVMGATTTFRKPFDMDELLNTIKSLIA